MVHPRLLLNEVHSIHDSRFWSGCVSVLASWLQAQPALEQRRLGLSNHPVVMSPRAMGASFAYCLFIQLFVSLALAVCALITNTSSA